MRLRLRLHRRGRRPRRPRRLLYCFTASLLYSLFVLKALRSQLLVYGVALTWLVGVTIALFGFFRISRAIRDEVNAHVRDMVLTAAQLLEDERSWVDQRGVAEGWTGITRRTCSLPELDDPELRALAAEALLPGRAVDVVFRPKTGLFLVCIERDGDDQLTITQCPLRGAHHLTDHLRDQVFSPGDPKGERATVTIFEGPRRVATNVRKQDGARAVDTVVSEPVARRVLEQGEPFNGRAWVVNRFVITCYVPIRTRTGEIVGMLYAGIDEEPYLARGRAALYAFLSVILVVTVLVSFLAVWLGRRLTRPLTELTSAARTLADGRIEPHREAPRSPEEIRILAESFAAMADRVVQRTEALESSREEAHEALESYLEVLAFVAHELKSPIAGAMTALELIDQGYVGEVPDGMRPTLVKLRRYLSRGLDMAVNFTYLSRAESRGFTVQKTGSDSIRTDLLEPAVADFADEAKRCDMPVSIEGDAPISADPALLRIVFDNLIGNAVKYGEPGTPITIRVDRADGRVRVAIRNRGVGIEERHHREIFLKFSRVDDKRLRGRRGSGVGLYLSHLIVDLHGGEISITGEYGEWVEFTVDLPA